MLSYEVPRPKDKHTRRESSFRCREDNEIHDSETHEEKKKQLLHPWMTAFDREIREKGGLK